ncbi:MAG TPA: TonB-dependent receptor [Steroidobacteraceae bacterium]|nr:TonB-dependent receptor [Steroidobacteraceae bacterium]
MKSAGRLHYRALVWTAVFAALIFVPSGTARAQNEVHEYNIPAGDLGEALRAFAAASNTQILFAPEVVEGRRSHGISGRLSLEAAMTSLLANTSLTYRMTASNVIIVMLEAETGVPPPASATPSSSVEAGEVPFVTLEEVIVTASKRLENVQVVPFSVLVVTHSAMERSNIRDFDDLVKIAPSVTITKTSQPGNNSINIRGIGTYAYSIATEPSVAVVIDEIPQAFQAAAFAALVDVKQIEVLRGPQNTLFGKSASAGVISITTQPATDEFTGRADVMTTDDGEHRVFATISGPVSEALKFRLAGNYSEYRGNIRNLSTGNWLNGNEDTTLRGKLVWEPDEDWTITLSPFYTRTIGSCCAPAEYFVSPGSTTGGAATGPSRIPMSTFLAGITPGPKNTLTRLDVDAQGNSEDYGAGLKIVRDIGDHTFTSITSYDSYRLDDRQDTDSTDIDFSAFQPISPAGGSANGGYFDIESKTQEFRLTSPEQRLRYVAGLFYSDTNSERYFVRGSNTLDDYNISPTPSPTPANLPTTNSTAYSRYLATARATNYALFGQGNLGLTEKLDFLLGLRVNREEIEYTFHDLGNNVTFGSPRCSTTAPSGTPIETCNHDTSVTGRTGFQYQFTPDVMAFTTYSRGYKGMAYDLTSTLTTRTPVANGPMAGEPLADVIASNQPVPAETVDSYELGIKTSFFDHRLNWNLTAFYMVFEGFQAQSRDQNLNQNLLNSIGEVTSRGVETEFAALFGNFSINAAGAWNEAIMEDFPNAGCFPRQTAAEGCVGNVQDLSGKPLFNAPEWKFNVNAQYEFAFGERLAGFVNMGYRWQSAVVFNLLQDPDSVQEAYGIANLSGGFKAEHWKVTAFVNNLFDESYALTRGRDAHINIPAGGNAVNWKPARDFARYYGLRASVFF